MMLVLLKRRLPGVEDRLESFLRKFDQPILDISSTDDDEAVKKAEQPASATTPTRRTTFCPNSDMENSFGELGDVDLFRAMLPQKHKRRRLIEAEDGPARYECIENLFPEETRAKDVQILEAAYKWKNDTNEEMKVQGVSKAIHGQSCP